MHVKKQVSFAALVAILQYLVITKTVSVSYYSITVLIGFIIIVLAQGVTRKSQVIGFEGGRQYGPMTINLVQIGPEHIYKYVN